MLTLPGVASIAALLSLVQGSPAPQGWSAWPSYASTTTAASVSAVTSTSSTPASSGSASANCYGYFEPLAPPYLNDLARSAGKLWFGSATDQPGTGEDTNILYQEILNDTGMSFHADRPRGRSWVLLHAVHHSSAPSLTLHQTSLVPSRLPIT